MNTGNERESLRVLVPLPDRDFDVTEVAVPWKLLTQAGHRVVFATEHAGKVPVCDPRLLSGVLFGRLGAADEPKRFYREMQDNPAFRNPLAWADIVPEEYDGLVLAGGHAPGMRQYLGGHLLHDKIAQFWQLGRPVGAICHGPVVLARTCDLSTGKSVLAGMRTTCLPGYMERLSYLLTFWKLGRYYRTYPTYVQDEIESVLDDPQHQFVRGPITLNKRGTASDDTQAFVVEDGRYISARWPGDSYLFARRFRNLIESVHSDRTLTRV